MVPKQLRILNTRRRRKCLYKTQEESLTTLTENLAIGQDPEQGTETLHRHKLFRTQY
jgi:uncharacterized protein (DUF927 family)